jgi:hypothetical protein
MENKRARRQSIRPASQGPYQRVQQHGPGCNSDRVWKEEYFCNHRQRHVE